MKQMLANISLRPYNTFGIDAKAHWFQTISSQEDAQNFINSDLSKKLPIWILGGGSNVLFTTDFEGIILKNEILGKEIVFENEAYIKVRVGGGENWHDFVQYCIDQNWGGIENLSLIPGSVGAAPIQNIGAYGVELQDVFVELEAMDLETGNISTFSKEACQFGYRYSTFKGPHKGKYLITHVVIELTKHNHQLNTSYGSIQQDLASKGITNPTIRDISEIICDIRRNKLPDPAEIGNAGSFFKNPVVSREIFEAIQQEYPKMPFYGQPDGQVKIPAGWLIEMCGWKGKRIDNYGVHAKQALVLVNYGGASGQAIYDLSSQILDSVQQTFGIRLEREVNVI